MHARNWVFQYAAHEHVQLACMHVCSSSTIVKTCPILLARINGIPASSLCVYGDILPVCCNHAVLCTIANVAAQLLRCTRNSIKSRDSYVFHHLGIVGGISQRFACLLAWPLKI